MTKEERLQQFERQTENNHLVCSDQILEAFARGYDEGFADGIVRGQNYQAQVTDMVLGNIFGEA